VTNRNMCSLRIVVYWFGGLLLIYYGQRLLGVYFKLYLICLVSRLVYMHTS